MEKTSSLRERERQNALQSSTVVEKTGHEGDRKREK